MNDYFKDEEWDHSDHKTREMIQWSLARHGKTIENADLVWSGQQPGELSEDGQDHAQHLGSYIARFSPDFINHSSLQRCVETCKIATAYSHFPDDHIESDDRLIEMGFGEIELKKPSQVERIVLSSGIAYRSRTDILLKDRRQPYVENLGVEPWISIEERLQSVIESMLDKFKKAEARKILTITHSVVAAYIAEFFAYGTMGENIPMNDDGNFNPQRHGQAVVLYFDEKINYKGLKTSTIREEDV